MTARTIIEKAMHDVSMYKNPNIIEAKILLNEILIAADIGDIEYDSIDSVDEYEGMIIIETTWSVRQCENNSRYEFPSSIIDAEDPIHAAKVWGMNKKVQKAESYIVELEEKLQNAKESLEYLLMVRKEIQQK